MKTIIMLLVISLFPLINGSGQADPKTKKSRNSDKMDDSSQSGRKLIESGIYEFQPSSAMPMSGGSISVISGQYFLRIEDDMAESALPFFGESHQADFTGSGGIQFKAKMRDYKLVNNEKKSRFKISFKASDSKDQYDVFMDCGYDGLASLRIGCYNKSPMTYYGYITKLSKPEKKKSEN